MGFKQKENPHSHRIVRDYMKINEIINRLEEPYDTMCRIQWETACRSGAVHKMKFNINLSDPKNSFIIKAIKEKKFNADVITSNQDSFWKNNDLCFVLLEEKRGKVLERVITPELYDWLVNWKEERLRDIKNKLDLHYNFHKKISIRRMNNILFPLTQRYYNIHLEKTAFSVGIQNFSSHWLRGSKATFLMENGMSLRKVQMQLGHSKSTTTERYSQADINSEDELKKYLELTSKSLRKDLI